MAESPNTSAQSTLRDTAWWVWLVLLLLLALFGAITWGVIYGVGVAWSEFTSLDKTVATAIVAGVFTVFASTITVMVGRYFEEKRKQSELHRERKIEMYDKFIARIFKLFADVKTDDSDSDTESEMIEFLRDSQRNFLLWSGSGVIRAYSEWHQSLAGQQDAQTVLKMEKFFLAVRNDLGHSNWRIKQGDTVRFILRHTDFFLEQIKTNPNITLTELAALENASGLNETADP